MCFEQHQLAMIIRYRGAGQCYRISCLLVINCHNINHSQNEKRMMKRAGIEQ